MSETIEITFDEDRKMTLLAYINVYPLWFIGGLPLFIGLSLLLCWLAKARFKKSNATLFSALLFTVLFTLFLTGVGPFVDRKEFREYMMTWETKPHPSNGLKESEVILIFVDFPSHSIGDYSDDLAAHLLDFLTLRNCSKPWASG